MYIKFCNFGPYADVKASGKSKEEPNADVYRRVLLYKRISAVFIIVSLLLLAVVIWLVITLSEGQSFQNCPDGPEIEEVELNCSRQLCQTMYPTTEAVQNNGYQCPECGKGWFKFENSCYFISKERQNWYKSRKDCQEQGGDLVVINNERVQKRLTERGGLLYWIGLHYLEKQRWMWINNTALTQSFWGHSQPEPNSHGSCALLSGGSSHMNNWLSNRCDVISHYICQRAIWNLVKETKHKKYKNARDIDGEKVTESEMKQIITAEVQDDKDARKVNTEGTKGYQCPECGKGWLKFENSCYVISKE